MKKESYHFATFISEHAQTDYDPNGEFLVSYAECFFSLAARAFAEDGVSREVLAEMLVMAALEIMQPQHNRESAGHAHKFILESVLSLIGMTQTYGNSVQRVPASATPLELSTTQGLASKEIIETIRRLREEEGCSRKEVYRVLVTGVLTTLKKEGANEAVLAGLREVLKDFGRGMTDPAMDEYLDKHSKPKNEAA